MGLQQVGHNCLLLRTQVARVPVFFRRTQFRCGQNRYRYHIWCMRVLVEPTFFWAFPEVWTCSALFVYSPGLGCLCRPLTTRNLRIRHAQTWGGLLLPFVRLFLANNSDIFIRREGMPLFDDRLVRVKPLQAVDKYTGGVGMRGLTSFCTR